MFKFLKTPKYKPPKLERKTYTIMLMHDYGHEIEIKNVSEESLIFIRNHLGRDEIYVQDNTIINLKTYSLAKIITKHNEKEKQQ